MKEISPNFGQWCS